MSRRIKVFTKRRKENVSHKIFLTKRTRGCNSYVYKKLGFFSEGIRPNFYEKPTEDAMIMWKR